MGRWMDAAGSEVDIRPLRQSEVEAAAEHFRHTFASTGGASDGLFEGCDWVRSRWLTDPEASFGIELDGRFMGSCFAVRWGSVGFGGPMSLHPDAWGRGLLVPALEHTLEFLDAAGTQFGGLFTLARDAERMAVYRQFGFHPRRLKAVMGRPVTPTEAPPGLAVAGTGDLDACRALADAVVPGLDLTREIRAVMEHGFGATLLLRGDAGLQGMAVCHHGPGTEAGADTCYVKFGAVRPGPGARERFVDLLAACESWAVAEGAGRLIAGADVGDSQVYEHLVGTGFRPVLRGVTMRRHGAPPAPRDDAWILDDWR